MTLRFLQFSLWCEAVWRTKQIKVALAGLQSRAWWIQEVRISLLYQVRELLLKLPRLDKANTSIRKGLFCFHLNFDHNIDIFLLSIQVHSFVSLPFLITGCTLTSVSLSFSWGVKRHGSLPDFSRLTVTQVTTCLVCWQMDTSLTKIPLKTSTLQNRLVEQKTTCSHYCLLFLKTELWS